LARFNQAGEQLSHLLLTTDHYDAIIEIRKKYSKISQLVSLISKIASKTLTSWHREQRSEDVLPKSFSFKNKVDVLLKFSPLEAKWSIFSVEIPMQKLLLS